MINKNIQAISPKDLLTYLCLRRSKNNVGESSVTIAKITKQTGASPVTVINSIERLKTSGHINGIKRGRSNVYKLLSNINATSFAFLDEDLSYTNKVKAAVKAAYVEDLDKNQTTSDSRLYDYVVKLEEEMVLQKKINEILIKGLEEARRRTSAMMGLEYEPLVFPTKP